uniref:Sulfotransferase n=1 Tax=Chrysemys picta bellii TaxID=8478 RepID=A0A8C3F521_CHRPI
MEPSEEFLFKHKGFYFHPGHVTPEYIDSLEDFEIRDSDVFVVTYPKSDCDDGRLLQDITNTISIKTVSNKAIFFPRNVWIQNILSFIYHEGHRDGTENMKIIARVPWLEYNVHNMDYVHRPSSRLFTTHLPYYLVPRDLRNRREKVIYVARNPKDVAVSYFHFSNFSVMLETIPDFNIFLERLLAGKGKFHLLGWSTHRDDFNILFLTYEEMKKDLRGTVLKICKFLGKQLNEKELDTVVENATFDKMKTDPRANYESMLGNLLERGKGHFLRKGTIGDWKNTMTVAQSERFDNVFKEKTKDLSSMFSWDINDDI